MSYTLAVTKAHHISKKHPISITFRTTVAKFLGVIFMVHTSTNWFTCAFNYTQPLHIHCSSSLIIHCHPGSLN